MSSLGSRASLTLVGLFAVLLAALAVLQYRWIGEVSRAETERLRRRLERSARSFSGELDRELGRLLIAFAGRRGGGPDLEAQLGGRYELWLAGAPYPELVRDVWLFERGADSGARRFDPERRAFVDAEWPGAPGDLLRRGWHRGSPLLPEVPALVVPVVEGGGPRRWPRRRRDGERGLAVVRLDAEVLRREILRDLAVRHFGPAAEREVALAVVDRESRQLVWASEPELELQDLLPGDVSAGLLGAGPFREPRPGGARRFGPVPPPLGAPPEEERRAGHWELVVRHSAGSLTGAVQSARRGSLTVSAGILGTLGVSAVLIVLSARRAERLARQQMEFVAGVTHELHTPLAAICSAGQNLADGVVSAPEQVRRYGSAIRKEGDRLTSSVGQILEFAGMQAGGRVYRSEPVAIDEVARAALADNALALEEAGMTAELDLPDAVPELSGDAAALRRALGNLIGNAVKFAAPGGWVGVRVVAQRGEVQVRVEDRGPGVAGEDRTRLFEPFYRGHGAEAARVRGSGLGLSIVEHVARGHGGRVGVDDRPGGGAAFVLHLPAPGEERG